MCCGMLLPVTSCTMARICVSCRHCSGTPTFRPRKSTRTCLRNGSKPWCVTCILWRMNNMCAPHPSPCVSNSQEAQLEELRALQSGGDSIAIGDEISRIEGKAAIALKELYGALTPWQKTQVARHPQRPHCIDYVAALITDFVPLAGDRKHGEDEAIIGGFGRFHGESICVIGHEKGSDTDSRLKHNFGMARPEGYRKA